MHGPRPAWSHALQRPDVSHGLKAVQRLLESSAEPSVAAGAGATALHAAASAGHMAIVDALIQASADVDVQVTITGAPIPWMSVGFPVSLSIWA